MKYLIALIVNIAFAFATQDVASGCHSKPDMKPGATTKFQMNFHDPAMNEKVTRKYRVQLPNNYDSSKQYPVVFWFHWWGDRIGLFPYLPYVDNQDVIVVYPMGMSDYILRHNLVGGWSSFNNGDAGVESICEEGTTPYCYLSCKRINKCGRCNSFTCYDDVHFVRKLLKEVESKYCIDSNSVSASGDSGGGMFTYYLSFQAADIIQNFGIIAGHPLVGRMGTDKKNIQGAYIIDMNGREDGTIPPQGGVDQYGEWIYESLDETFKGQKGFGHAQGCDLNSWTHIDTPWDNFVPTDGGIDGMNLDCMEFTKGCSGRVVQCMHDGGHQVIPEYMADLTWWFWKSRTQKQDVLETPAIMQN